MWVFLCVYVYEGVLGSSRMWVILLYARVIRDMGGTDWVEKDLDDWGSNRTWRKRQTVFEKGSQAGMMGQAGGQGKEEDRPGPGQAGTHYDTGGLKANLR